MSVKLKKVFVLFCAAAVLASCVDDLGIGAPKESKLDEIYFTASIAEQDFFGAKKAQTRSAADERQRVQAGFYDLAIDGRNDIRLSVSTLDGMFGKPAPMPEEGKSKATTRGAMLTELAQKPMTVIEYVKTSDGKTVVGEPYTAYTEDGATWGGSHIQQNGNTVSRTLHAIYPSSESYTIDPESHTFSYTTPFIAEDQSDLLYADAEHGLGTEAKDSVHLTFDHLLTAVRFKIGSQQLPMSVIRNIAIDGIEITGTYNFQTKRWELSKNVNGVMCNLNFNATGVKNAIINGGESTFMLLPQQLTPNAKLTIYYEDYTEGDDASNGVKTLTATLATANTPAWEAGQCITYTLMDHEADNEYILDVEAPKDFTAAGGEQPVNVLSYRQAEGVRTPMKWIVQSYSSDGGRTWMSGGATNVPKGMSISPTEGTSVKATPISVTLFAADSICAPHRDFLRYKTPLGYDGEAFDLSRHGYLNEPCAQTTANCYVVDAPGKYRIPTAYGNAIVDGETNKDAYTDKTGNRIFETKNNFMTHNGKAITAPMIKNNGITLSRATLVWEDVKDLIDPNSIKLVDDGNAIEFEILPDNIDQGNAVIAVMDGNNVAWSWHIWVTDEKATLAEPIEDANKYGEQVDFMPLTLGWCSTANASGQIGREAAVRITMPEHLSKQACIRIRQNSTSSRDTYENTVGNATYYNWGRKDPFPGAISTDMPIESNENAKSLPKPFYQAGADAAALGLHAELHTEYSTNIRDLLLQGALVGLDGFLVGKTITDIRNILKKQEFYANAQELAGHKVTISEEPVWTKVRSDIPKSPNDIAAINQMIHKEGYVIDIFHESASEPYSFRVLPANSETGLSVIYQDANKLPTNIVKITKSAPSVQPVTNKVLYTYTYQMYSVKVLDPVASICLGDFSGALLSATGQALKSNFDLGKILSSTSLFSGSTDWCREISSHGVGINYGIQHPNILLRDPISWINYDYVGNLWNVNQTAYDEKDIIVCKSIYDPCPAGYCVPTARDMSGIDDKQTIISHFGATAKTSSLSDGVVRFPAVGCRNFWAGAEPGSAVTNNINDLIFLNGEQGMYWTSSPAINLKEDGEKGAYVINFRGTDSYNDCGEQGVKYTPRVVNDMKLQQSYALPIRPVREKQSQKYDHNGEGFYF